MRRFFTVSALCTVYRLSQRPQRIYANSIFIGFFFPLIDFLLINSSSKISYFAGYYHSFSQLLFPRLYASSQPWQVKWPWCKLVRTSARNHLRVRPRSGGPAGRRCKSSSNFSKLMSHLFVRAWKPKIGGSRILACFPFKQFKRVNVLKMNSLLIC